MSTFLDVLRSYEILLDSVIKLSHPNPLFDPENVYEEDDEDRYEETALEDVKDIRESPEMEEAINS